MKELFWMIVSSLLAMVGYGKDEEPAHGEDDPYDHLWWDIGGEGGGG